MRKVGSVPVVEGIMNNGSRTFSSTPREVESLIGLPEAGDCEDASEYGCRKERYKRSSLMFDVRLMKVAMQAAELRIH